MLFVANFGPQTLLRTEFPLFKSLDHHSVLSSLAARTEVLACVKVRGENTCWKVEQWALTSSSLPPTSPYHSHWEIRYQWHKVKSTPLSEASRGRGEGANNTYHDLVIASSNPQQPLCAKPIISVERLPLSRAQQVSLSDSHQCLELLAKGS